jgi:quercetin dioxygenase-like cupin family protein
VAEGCKSAGAKDKRRFNEMGETRMIVKNYRDVRAVPVLEEPGVTVRWLVSELDAAPHYALRLYEIEPGRATTAHTPYWEHQVFVLAGRGAVSAGDREALLGEGDMVYISPGERHQLVNRGKQPFRFLMVLPIPQDITE